MYSCSTATKGKCWYLVLSLVLKKRIKLDLFLMSEHCMYALFSMSDRYLTAACCLYTF